jgi:predicted secreted protein
MPLELSDTDTSVTHALSTADEVVLRLAENPTTGYRWVVTQSGTGQLDVLEDRYGPGAASAAPGAGGERVVRLVARRPGDVRLEAVLARAWESGQAPMDRRVYALVVR